MSNLNQSDREAVVPVTKEQLKDADFRSQPLNALDLSAVATPKENAGKEKEDPASSPADTKTEEKDGKGKSGLEKKFAKLTAARDSEREQKELLLQRLSDLEKRVTPAAKQDEQKTSNFKYDKPKPKVDDKDSDGKELYESMADHAEAVANWTYDKREAEKASTSRDSEFKTAADKTFNGFFKDGETVETDLGLEAGEWAAVVRDDQNRLSGGAVWELAEMPDGLGAKIAYDIFSNAEVKEKFEKLNERQQVAFVGKLQAKEEAKAEAKSNGGNKQDKQISKAKEPAKNIKGSTNAVKFDRTKPLSELAASAGKIQSQADYRRMLRN